MNYFEKLEKDTNEQLQVFYCNRIAREMPIHVEDYNPGLDGNPKEDEDG